MPLAHARHFHGDPTVGRRLEQATNRIVTPHSQFEEVRTQLRAVQRRLEQAQASAAEPRRHFGAGHIQPETGRPASHRAERRAASAFCERDWSTICSACRPSCSWSAPRLVPLDRQSVPYAGSGGAGGSGHQQGRFGFREARSVEHFKPMRASTIRELLRLGTGPLPAANAPAVSWRADGATSLRCVQERRVADRGRTAAPAPTPVKQAVKEAVRPVAKEAQLSVKPAVRLASLDSAEPVIPPLPSRIPSNVGASTRLVDFETAPFPYHGVVPGSGRPFLNAGDQNRRGHVTFRGQVLWESQTFSDDRVLLHIPSGFDPNRPAVMVVFFHGHGANLCARCPRPSAGAGADYRGRRQTPCWWRRNLPSMPPIRAPENSGSRTASSASSTKRPSSSPTCMAIRAVSLGLRQDADRHRRL